MVRPLVRVRLRPDADEPRRHVQIETNAGQGWRPVVSGLTEREAEEALRGKAMERVA